ncbi:DUF2812 domain-containing protein [Undibacterium sp. Ji42W]|uniref:DUF2812 domain-containing protein n=1 Tax=Undibacterium sp. Ji42W TaxID=3413039 RepID=UPI003BF19B0E
MEGYLIKKFKCFWSWEDEEEQQWLQEMASQGMHLKARSFFGIYRFLQDAPADIVYRLDYVSNFNWNYVKTLEPDANYQQLISDAGWEHVLQASGWQYWRMPVRNGKVPEIYTDLTSKRGKYQRLLLVMCVWNLTFLPTALYPQGMLNHWDHAVLAYIVMYAIVMPTCLCFSYASLRILMRMRQLVKI